MIAVTACYCLGVLGLCSLAALYRIVKGPTVADRVAATDLLTSCIMAVVVIAGIQASTRAYLDVVMALGILGFFGTVALARYLIGGRVID